MENSQINKDISKVKNIITSCNNNKQLEVAKKTYEHLLKKYGAKLEGKQQKVLEELIKLMTIKCNPQSKNTEDKLISEKNPITKEFEIAAAQAGPPLNQIAFIQEEEDTLKEINIGTQIEKNHLPLKDAESLATQNVEKIPDYYTNPNFCIIAVESKNGEKKTVRVEKELYEKSKKDKQQLLLADMEIFHEMLDMNDISKSLKNQLRRKNSKRFSKDEIYKEIRKRREEEIKRREKDGWPSLIDEEEIDEATSAAASGAYVPKLGSSKDIITRPIAQTEIPVSKNGMTKPIGKMMAIGMLEEEEELGEAVDYAGAVGAYVTPAMWAKNKSEWRGAHVPTYKGGKFVNIKKKCKTFPYCNQGAGSVYTSNTSDMEIDNVFTENKIIKKSNLKLKK
tara:strand:+ start:383 stop:1564 length:1182 start_codon:yes stop_codon:yes gene_type:complete